MADVTWFKVLTDIFADDKIKILQSMPEGDSILVMWFKVLSQAGKTNDGGYIYLRKNIPYTTNMLATLFEKPPMLVELALKTFTQFEMIDIDEKGYIFVTNWEKHQNIEGMDKVKEQNRLRNKRFRDKKRLELTSGDVTRDASRDVTVTQSDGTDIEEDLDLEKIIYTSADILKLLNRFKVKIKGTFQVDLVASYIGVVDNELIEQAIKRSEGKNVPYVLEILGDMQMNPDGYREDKTANGKSRVGKTQKAAYRQETGKQYIDKKVDRYYGPNGGESDY